MQKDSSRTEGLSQATGLGTGLQTDTLLPKPASAVECLGPALQAPESSGPESEASNHQCGQ